MYWSKAGDVGSVACKKETRQMKANIINKATIESVQIDVVRRPVSDDIRTVFGINKDEMNAGIVRIRDSHGLEGHCTISSFWGTCDPSEIISIITTQLKPYLIGRSTDCREWFWSQHLYLQSRHRSTWAAYAPIDIALWDLAGKQAKKPVVDLIGRAREAVRAYLSFATLTPEITAYEHEIGQTIDRGFDAYKLHPERLSASDVTRIVDRVRELAGCNVDLMLDPNCGYDLSTALEVGAALDANAFRWFEDPVRHFDFDAIEILSQRLSTPLSMCDQAPDQFHDSARYIRDRTVVSPRGSARVLGITGLRKLMSMSEGFGMICEIGLAGSPLMNLANAHVLQSVSYDSLYEHFDSDPIQSIVLNDYIQPAQGRVSVPDRPGLGHDLDENWIDCHRVAVVDT